MSPPSSLGFFSFSSPPPPLPKRLSHRALVVYLMSLDPLPLVPFPFPQPPLSTAIFPPLGSSYLPNDLAPMNFVFPLCPFFPNRPFCSSFPVGSDLVWDRSSFPTWIRHCRLSWVVIGCFLRLFPCFSICFWVSLFRSSGVWWFVVLHLLQVCHAPPPRQASIASSRCGVSAGLRPGFPSVDPLFFGFPCFCLGFSVFALVSLYLFWCFALLLFYLFMCFLGFFVVSADLLWAGFATLRPLLGFFCAPHRDNLPSCFSLYEVSVHTISFFPCIFFLLVFSSIAFLFPVFRLLFACNNALASMVCLDPLWSWPMCHGWVRYPGFRVKEEKWSRLLCHG